MLLTLTATACGACSPTSQIPETSTSSQEDAPAPIAADAPRIDTHMHLRGATEDGSLALAGDNLVARMDVQSVDVAVLQELPEFGGGYEALFEIAAGHPGRIVVAAGSAALNPMIQRTDPAQVDDAHRAAFRAQAEAVADQGIVAFGEMFGLHLCMAEHHNYQVAAPNHPLFKELADVAAERGIPIDLHTEAVPHDQPMLDNMLLACSQNPDELVSTIPELEELLEHNRAANIVWQHIGWDNTGYMTVELLRHLLSKHANLHLAIRVEQREFQVGSSAPMENRIVDEQWQLRPTWAELFDEFPDRILVGGDEFISPMAGQSMPSASFDETWDLVAGLDSELAYRIGAANASRIYTLDK